MAEEQASVEAAMAVLDRFMVAFNSADAAQIAQGEADGEAPARIVQEHSIRF